MAKRITHDVPIGMSTSLLQSVDAWAKYLNQPRSEYCREIIARHQHRIGYFPEENADTKPSPMNPLLAG